MARNFLFAAIILLLPFVTNAQNKQEVKKVHKIIFQLTSDDTLSHKGLVKQLNNVLTAAPTANIEVVCHGPGITLLEKDKTILLDKLQQLKSKGVVFMACQNTMKDRNISPDKIIPEAGFVPSGLIEVITKQEEGWSYIKAGF